MTGTRGESVEAAQQAISLLDSLSGEWLKLPLAVMQDVGPAVQTLAGLLKLTNRETYASVEKIAQAARLPVTTAKKHLRTLHDHGWIDNRGRERTRGGRLRRTATITVTKKTRDAASTYGLLPWWACCRGKVRLRWCARAVLSVVMSRLLSLKAAAERDGDYGDEDELVGAIENMGGNERFRFSLPWLATQTGLSRHSIITGKGVLHRAGIVQWSGDGDDHQADILLPNWAFCVVSTAADPGYVHVSFDRGCKSGQ